MGSTEVQLWKQKEWSTIKRHKTENSDVRKRTGTSVVKPKCIFDLCNTYINGMDYTDQYHSQHHAQGNKKIMQYAVCSCLKSQEEPLFKYIESETINFQTLKKPQPQALGNVLHKRSQRSSAGNTRSMSGRVKQAN
jgi:hypothetical protein